LGGADGGNNQNSIEYPYSYGAYINGQLYTEYTSIPHAHNIVGNTGASGNGTEVRPNNVAVIYIIKA